MCAIVAARVSSIRFSIYLALSSSGVFMLKDSYVSTATQSICSFTISAFSYADVFSTVDGAVWSHPNAGDKGDTAGIARSLGDYVL